MHNHFFEYYIKNVLPELKKFEDERKRLKKKIYRIILISGIILMIPISYAIIHTRNYYAVKLLGFAFVPALYLFKDKINNFSDKYKQNIIKFFLEEYFTNVEIYPLEKLDYNVLIESKLINITELSYKANSDIRVVIDNNHFQLCEINFFNRIDSEIVFKGLFCIGHFNVDFEDELIFLDSTVYNNQIFYLKDEYIQQTIDPNNRYTIYSKNKIINTKKFDDLTNILAEFREGISLHFNKNLIYGLITFNNLSRDNEFDLFEPDILDNFNSQETYKNVMKEYYRIKIIGKLFKILDIINIPVGENIKESNSY